MKTIADLDLAELPIQEPSFAANPWPQIAAAREKHPWVAKSPLGYVVFGYQQIKDLYDMDEKLTLSVEENIKLMGAEGTAWGKNMKELLISKQGEEHARLRSLVAEMFAPRNINRYRDIIRSTITALLDEWAPKGEFDFADFAANFPIRVMCRVIGASPDVVPALRESLETAGLSFAMDPSLLPDMEKAFSVLWDFVDELIDKRIAEKRTEGEDLLDDMIVANTSGLVSDYDLRNLLVFLFGAGYDTSKNMLNFIMYEILQHPEHWERCAESLEYATKVMNETFRYHSVSNVPRTARVDIEYNGLLIPKGTILIFTLTVSGRDPGFFDKADEFNPELTRENRHITFGRGAHMCLGQFLARAQIEEGLHLIAQRLKNPRLDGEVTWRSFVGVWGVRTLPIVYDPAP